MQLINLQNKNNIERMHFLLFVLFCCYAFSICISLAVSNVFSAVITVLGVLSVYMERDQIPWGRLKQIRIFIYAFFFFGFTLLCSAVFSGNIGNGIKAWMNYFVIRPLPVFLGILLIRNLREARIILGCAVVSFFIVSLSVVYDGIQGAFRPHGFYGSPLVFAQLGCAVVPILLVAVFDEVLSAKFWLISVVMLSVCSAALFYCSTRGAWLALAIIFVFVGAIASLKSKKCLMLFTALMIAVGVSVYSSSGFMNRVQSITNTQFQSNTERVLMWKSAFNMFKDHPAFGVGLGRYTEMYHTKYVSPDAKEPHLRHAHSNYFQMLGENGFFGFIGYLGFVLSQLYMGWMYFIRRKERSGLMLFTVSAAVALQGFTNYNFANPGFSKFYWLMMGLCMLMMIISQRSNSLSTEQITR